MGCQVRSGWGGAQKVDFLPPEGCHHASLTLWWMGLCPGGGKNSHAPGHVEVVPGKYIRGPFGLGLGLGLQGVVKQKLSYWLRRYGRSKGSQCTESVQALKSCIISVKDTGLGLGLGLQGVVKQKLSYWLRRYGRSNCLYRITEERSQCTESVQALKSCIISVKDTGLGLGLGLQGAAQNKQGRGAY
ncbi:uncharacterized protein PSFLO_02836 [Pseudozyma flocculosa]|uniref:Uncharacterized protein n=1 Tax=Pseudozyma flocculosa TaxID=84751 RepID=A0A5C3EYM9_9BASI|nr:uncharacterized protein PSFLO_02833 [Pseudozyma flocculosa]SPO37363.1 uncharacterized protein PSFLO_02836 [Pseudozyma flocculosa]